MFTKQMKILVLVLAAFLCSGAAYADDVLEAIQEATEAYNEKAYTEAVESLEYAKQLIQQLTDMAIVLHHAIGINAVAGFLFGLRLEVGPDMHPGGVVPDEERLVCLLGPANKVLGRGQDFLVNGLHPLLAKGP